VGVEVVKGLPNMCLADEENGEVACQKSYSGNADVSLYEIMERCFSKVKRDELSKEYVEMELCSLSRPLKRQRTD
jgi:hypothetical protein